MDLEDFPLKPIVVDTEFIPGDDGSQWPVCVVAKDPLTGEVFRLFAGEFGSTPGFLQGPDVCLVAHNAAAELETFRALGWSLPINIFDTYFEHMGLTNGLNQPRLNNVAVGKRGGLLAALRCWGIHSRAVEEKRGMIARIVAGPPYSGEDRREILKYCQEDVEDTALLFRALLKNLSPQDIAGATLRGSYANAIAAFNRNGYPVDGELHDRIISSWGDIRQALIQSIDRFGVYVNGKFSRQRLENLIQAAGADDEWPLTKTGLRSTEEDVWRKMAVAFPSIAEFCETQISVAQMDKIHPLAIGPDGRVRLGKREMAHQRLGLLVPDNCKSAGWGAFRSKTGRNQPAAKEFVLLRSSWWRKLITPPPGQVLIYFDWSGQEAGIACYLSRDPVMIRHYEGGDFYIAFGKEANLVPPHATKETHGDIRDKKLKKGSLGPLYGMTEHGMALALGISRVEARELLQAHRATYRTFWRWSEDKVDAASLVGHISTLYGWRMHIGDLGRARPGSQQWMTSETTLQNWTMQATGGEVLRVACVALTDAGYRIAFPLHDAIAVECNENEMDDVIRHVSYLMEQAAVAVLGGRISVDAEVIRSGETMQIKPKAEPMWRVVKQAIERRSKWHRKIA